MHAEIVERLGDFRGRAPASDAERRAAVWLRDTLRARGRAAELETVWVRPRWALSYALHAALALVGTLVGATASAGVGLGLLAVALVSLVGDLSGRLQLLRVLTPRRATQNVVSPAPPSSTPKAARIVLLAAYDAPPRGLAVRRGPRRLAARVEGLLGGHGPGPAGILLGSIAALTAIAAARALGGGDWTKVASLPFATVLVVAIFALADLVPADPRDPGLGDASAVAVALSLVAELARTPPRNLAVELVLTGAGHGPALGARAWVRSQRKAPRERTVVLNIAPSVAGAPYYWVREGAGVAFRYHAQLIAFCRRIAGEEPGLGVRGRVSRFASGALPARLARFPAITIGTAPAGDAGDAGAPAEAAMRSVVELGLAITDLADEAVAGLADHDEGR